MSTNHDAVTALPINAAPNQTLLRNVLVARMPYVLADTDNPTSLVAVDPTTGAGIVDIAYLGRVFHFDPTDTTTANDGVSCLVSNEGRRYKLASGTDVSVWAVLSMSPTAPPGSPALGDCYLVPAGATGAWAGKGGYVAVRTARGWEFVLFGIGRLLYVEDLDAYYHRNAAGSWVAGLGSLLFAPKTVPLSSSINFGRVFQVENQTTNTPPVSVSPGVAYVIGSSPTGAWAGGALQLAICEATNQFTVYAPNVGDIIYDKAIGGYYRFTGTAWRSLFGAWRQVQYVTTSNGNTTVVGSSVYAPSATVAPATTDRKTVDNASLSVAAASGSLIKLTYSAAAFATGGTPAGQQSTVALFRDSVVSAIDWKYQVFSNAGYLDIAATFLVTAPDALAHTYSAAIMSISGPIDMIIVRRNFIAEAVG